MNFVPNLRKFPSSAELSDADIHVLCDGADAAHQLFKSMADYYDMGENTLEKRNIPHEEQWVQAKRKLEDPVSKELLRKGLLRRTRRSPTNDSEMVEANSQHAHGLFYYAALAVSHGRVAADREQDIIPYPLQRYMTALDEITEGEARADMTEDAAHRMHYFIKSLQYAHEMLDTPRIREALRPEIIHEAHGEYSLNQMQAKIKDAVKLMQAKHMEKALDYFTPAIPHKSDLLSSNLNDNSALFKKGATSTRVI